MKPRYLPFVRSRFFWISFGVFCAGILAYAGIYHFSKSHEKNKLKVLEEKALELNQALSDYQQTGLTLLRDVPLAEQVFGALQSKTFNQLIQIRFLLQAIQEKCPVPGIHLSVLDEKGNFLSGSTRLRNVDSSVVMLGLYGEERLFARMGGSFFDSLYFEGVAPLMKAGRVTGLVHLEMPLGQELLKQARQKTGEEVFLFTREELEGATLFSSEDPSQRKPYLELLRRDLIPSQIQAAYLGLAGDRSKLFDLAIHPHASTVVVPLRGMGGEVVAMLVTLIPEKGFFVYRDVALRSLEIGLGFLAAIWFVRCLIWLALRLSQVRLRTVTVVLVLTVLIFGMAVAAGKAIETSLWRRLEAQNNAAVVNLEKVFADYQAYLAESVGAEREEMRRHFLRLLKGEKVRKPSRYEFVEIPLGLHEKPGATRLTDSHLPVRWNGLGVFSDRAEAPFSREKEVYKVPVGRFAQKIWLVYSSAWGYLNKFGSPYGTRIGAVKVVFENGNTLEIELQNGVNVHDRFSPPTKISAEKPPSQKAFEFISELDPLHRVQYVEEMEILIPPLYAEAKIDYLLFEDERTPDLPIFYAATLGVKKVPALPAKLKTIEETENEIELKKEWRELLASVALAYYEGDRPPESGENSAFYGTPGRVTHWPIPEKGFEKPLGMIAILTPAPYLKPIEQAFSLIHGGFRVFLLILGVVWIGNLVTSQKKLRFKLVSFSFLVSCVPLLLILTLVGFWARQREEAAAQFEAARSLEQAEIYLRELKRRAEDLALRLLSNEGLLEAAQKGEEEKIQQILNEARVVSFSDFPSSFLAVKKNPGKLGSVDWGTPSYRSLSLSTRKLMDTSGSGVFINNVSSAILGVNRVFIPETAGGNKEEVLAVLAGIPLDPYSLSEIKRRGGAEFALFVGDTLRFSTVDPGERKIFRELTILGRRHYMEITRRGENQFGMVRSQHEQAMVGTLPLKDESGRLSGMLAAVSWKQPNMFPDLLSSKKIFLYAALFVLALAGLLSTMISRSITQPIAVLAQGAERIAHGELGSSIAVAARDEIGELAHSFNQMSSSLKENQSHLEQKIADLLTLQRLSTKVSSVLEKEELLHLVVKLFCELAGFEKGMLLLRDAETHRFVVASGIGIRKTDFGNLSFSAEETMAGAAVKERKMIYVKNHLIDERVPHNSVHLKGSSRPLQIVALPLMAKGNEIGAVVLEHPDGKEPAIRVEEVLLMTLANHAAVALENARLYEMAVEDGLTKVFVNRYFQFRMAEEVEHAKRYRTHLALVLVDLDHFKSINDTYGHPIGDKILISTAQVMKKTFRSTDVVCRYGGDEFAIILPKTGGEEALQIAERLRHEVEKLDFPVDGKIILRVTLSVGIAAWAAPMDRESLIKAADHALYAAKTGGRNRVARHNQTA